MSPLLGVLFHWMGGLASGSFYVPYRGVRNWAWETYWLVGGFFSWIIMPWTMSLAMTNDVVGLIRHAPLASIGWTFAFGVLWGIGGLTFGLAMRYLGMSLGMAIALGFTAAFGTLLPPIFRGVFKSELLSTHSGLMVLTGVGMCLLGIMLAGAAGISKQRVLREKERQESIKEFNLKKGLLVATFAGIMSACFAFGLAAGDPIKVMAVQHGTSPLWQGLPVLIIELAGGFITNFVWCITLNILNRTGYQYFGDQSDAKTYRTSLIAIQANSGAPELVSVPRTSLELCPSIPLLRNYFLSALAGITWYMQYFFYTMGEAQMGKYSFSSWTLHMASIIIFSTLWGIALKEWKGTGQRTGLLLALSLLVLCGSTFVVGYGNYLGVRGAR